MLLRTLKKIMNSTKFCHFIFGDIGYEFCPPLMTNTKEKHQPRDPPVKPLPSHQETKLTSI